MKQIAILLMAVGLSFGATAQKKLIKGNFRPSVPSVSNTTTVRPPANANNGSKGSKVIVVAPRYNPYAFYNPYMSRFGAWGSPYGFGYDPFFAFNNVNRQSVPSDLDFELDRVRNNYAHEIATVRHDDALPKSERRQRIRDLKHQRENAILDAKEDYFRRRNY